MRNEPSMPDFTPQETQVLDLMADGMSDRAIAAELGIDDWTVSAHIASILWKLRTRPDLKLRNRPDKGKGSI
jgi:DNA-binding NarL/FixJ family response regulator